jgi:hypothetical protein
VRTPGEQPADAGEGGAGRLIAGRYRVRRALGRGGMGVVWKAVDEVLGREVALKELRTYTDAAGPELADLRTRMQREARAAARVRHPGVIAVHDIAQHEGRPVIVMELIDGPSLDDVLRRSGTLGPREAAAIGAKVLDALVAAHSAGVLHRDVKPGNVLLERGGEGRVVLTDFGIAAMEDPGDGATTRLTGSGELVGSLDYLSPERARGEPPVPASDVWALGATLYAAVEGASPFRRTSTWSTLTAIVVDPLPEPVHAGPLAPVLAELMAKDPALRADPSRAAALLDAVAAGRPLPPEGETVRLGRRDPARPGVGQGVGEARDVREAGPGRSGGTPAPDAAGQPGAGAGASGTSGTSGASGTSGTPRGSGTPGIAGASGVEGGPQQRQALGHQGRVAPSGQGDTGHGREDADGTLNTASAAGRTRRGRVIAAAVAVLVLAGAGATWAAFAGSGAGANGGGGRGGGPRSAHANSGAREGGSADARGAGKGEESRREPGGGSDSGSAAAGGSHAPRRPRAGCHGSGGGKYDCKVWKSATTFNAAHRPVGQLNPGTNYFYCQTKLSERESSGRWTNVWWAKTDDDSGNTGVYISDVYLVGGENDKPVPGLPTC